MSTKVAVISQKMKVDHMVKHSKQHLESVSGVTTVGANGFAYQVLGREKMFLLLLL